MKLSEITSLCSVIDLEGVTSASVESSWEIEEALGVIRDQIDRLGIGETGRKRILTTLKRDPALNEKFATNLLNILKKFGLTRGDFQLLLRNYEELINDEKLITDLGQFLQVFKKRLTSIVELEGLLNSSAIVKLYESLLSWIVDQENVVYLKIVFGFEFSDGSGRDKVFEMLEFLEIILRKRPSEAKDLLIGIRSGDQENVDSYWVLVADDIFEGTVDSFFSWNGESDDLNSLLEQIDDYLKDEDLDMQHGVRQILLDRYSSKLNSNDLVLKLRSIFENHYERDFFVGVTN